MRKRNVVGISFIILFFFVIASAVAVAAQMKRVTGEVTAIDPAGKGIVVMTGMGKEMRDVGTIITPETKVMVKGKPASLSDIKVNDKVTLVYERTSDLYAKEIIKK